MSKEKQIKQIVNEFFKKMTWEESPDNFDIRENTVCFELKTDTPEILIGKRGEILNNIQYLLARVISKKLDEKIFVDFDINQYKKKKTDYLKEIAKNIADEVALTKKEKQLMPMSSFERRIVHLCLSERQDIVSESTGQEPDRRVIIKPANL